MNFNRNITLCHHNAPNIKNTVLAIFKVVGLTRESLYTNPLGGRICVMMWQHDGSRYNKFRSRQRDTDGWTPAPERRRHHVHATRSVGRPAERVPASDRTGTRSTVLQHAWTLPVNQRLSPRPHGLHHPLTPHCWHMGAAIKHPVPDLVKPSFVIFDIRALWRSGLSVRVPGCQKLQMTA